MTRPAIAITMGDAAGIGPEITVKTLQDASLYKACRPISVADADVMRQTIARLGLSTKVNVVSNLEEARYEPGILDILEPSDLGDLSVTLGRVAPDLGSASAVCIRQAMALAAAGEVQAIVSAPMNKEAFHQAGYDYGDEMEYMAALSDCKEAFSMGVMGRVWETRVTEHVAFRQIADLITRDGVLRYTRRLHDVLQSVGIDRPRLAVAALNVHGGEGGIYGREEIDHIAPAIADAVAEGINAVGPIPADTVFARALAGEFDGVVGMYHDQVNIARKLQPLGERATIFMGLPVPVTTTAHGTAFDIAGRGTADPSGFRAALDQAILLAQ